MVTHIRLTQLDQSAEGKQILLPLMTTVFETTELGTVSATVNGRLYWLRETIQQIESAISFQKTRD